MNAKKVIYFLLIIPRIFPGNVFAQQTQAKHHLKLRKDGIEEIYMHIVAIAIIR